MLQIEYTTTCDRSRSHSSSSSSSKTRFLRSRLEDILKRYGNTMPKLLSVRRRRQPGHLRPTASARWHLALPIALNRFQAIIRRLVSPAEAPSLSPTTADGWIFGNGMAVDLWALLGYPWIMIKSPANHKRPLRHHRNTSCHHRRWHRTPTDSRLKLSG